MYNRKGFLTIEIVFYMIICLITILLLNIVILNNINYTSNDLIKINQSFKSIRLSLIKYQSVTNFSSKEISFNDEVKIRIVNDKIYETPGYMPYFHNIERAKFIYYNKTLSLSFDFKEKKYQQIIFYDK